MRFDLVVNRFIAMAASNEPILVFGGAQFRPFIHLEDVADAFLKALDAEATGLFNLGGVNYRIIEVANLIKERMDAEVNVFSDIKDPRDYRVDSSLAIETFGLHFDRTVEYAIEEIKHFIKNINYRDPIYNNEEWLRSNWKC